MRFLGWIGENTIGTFTFSVRAWYSQVWLISRAGNAGTIV
jgi:hypothetical protein